MPSSNKSHFFRIFPGTNMGGGDVKAGNQSGKRGSWSKMTPAKSKGGPGRAAGLSGGVAPKQDNFRTYVLVCQGKVFLGIISSRTCIQAVQGSSGYY